MAHFAKLGANSKVIQVLTLNNSDMLNADGVEDETVGQQYLETHNNWPAQMWIKTSYNTSGGKHYTVTTNEDGTQTRTESADQSKALRGNYAGIGYTWDEDDQIFWPKKPYASWVKHNASASWKSPIGDAPALTEEQTSQNEAATHSWHYVWNEANTTWDLTNSLA
jgi:glutaredoxin-related protein